MSRISTQPKSTQTPRPSTAGGPSLRDRLGMADRHRDERVWGKVRRDIRATGGDGGGAGPYVLRGLRKSEVWLGPRLLGSYTTHEAAAHLADELNAAFAEGYLAAVQDLKKLEAGPIVLQMPPGAAEKIMADFAAAGVHSGQVLPGDRPLATLGPGGDFTQDIDAGGESVVNGSKSPEADPPAEAGGAGASITRGPARARSADRGFSSGTERLDTYG